MKCRSVALLIRIWIWTHSHWRRNWAEIMSGHVSCHFYSFVFNIGSFVFLHFSLHFCVLNLKKETHIEVLMD